MSWLMSEDVEERLSERRSSGADIKGPRLKKKMNEKIWQ